MQEWFSLLRDLGQQDHLSAERMSRMKQIEHRQRHNNFLGLSMAMLREEYIKDCGYIALRIKLFDDWFALPWYKRIFSRPHRP